MSKSKSRSGKARDIRVHKGEITHDRMAEYIMGRYTFKTLSDTDEVLYYSPKYNKYRFGGDRLIQKIAEKTLERNYQRKLPAVIWRK